MEVLYIAIVLAKSFITAGDEEEEEILLPVKVIAKVKKAFSMLDLAVTLSVALSRGGR